MGNAPAASQAESLDTEDGQFRFGWAPRKKTARPQLLEIPEMLRPLIRDWWQRAGKPDAGLLFSARRGAHRAYSQALANAGASAQQAQALAGHASLDAHARYLNNTSKMALVPAAALPTIQVLPLLVGKTSRPEGKSTKAKTPAFTGVFRLLRGEDLNLRPSGYEPDELPGCSTARQKEA